MQKALYIQYMAQVHRSNNSHREAVNLTEMREISSPANHKAEHNKAYIYVAKISKYFDHAQLFLELVSGIENGALD